MIKYNIYLLLGVAILITSCNADGIYTQPLPSFCPSLAADNINALVTPINKFFAELNYTDEDETYDGEKENMENFIAWLKSYPCIIEAEIVCTSCILTLPAQTEVTIAFLHDGQLKYETMDLLMSIPIQFRTFHH
jgi:hypothetical protein